MLLFEHLNLRHNPFETPTPEGWARLAITAPEFDAEALADWVRETSRAVLILGKCGRGKSTHAQAIRAHVPNAPWVYVGPGERPDLPRAPLLFVDEAQRLGTWRRRRLWRRGTSFVVTSHTDHTAEMERAGLAVQTFEISGLDLPTLRRIVDLRIESARRAPGPVPTLSDAALRTLIADFDDDLRAMLDVLYDVFQTLESPAVLNLDDVRYRALEQAQTRSQHKR